MNKAYISKAQKITELLSYLFLLINFLIIIRADRMNMGRIPTHFDLMGNPDGYEEVISLIVLPVIMLLTNAMISVILHFVSPQAWNMPFKVKEKNKALVYHDMIWMLASMICMFSLYMLLLTILVLTGGAKFIFPVTILLMVGLVASIAIPIVIAKKHNEI